MKKKFLSLALMLIMMAAFVPFYSVDLPTVSAASAKVATVKITAQPTSVTAKNNAWLTFTVKATGESLRYQWQLSDDQGKTWRNSSTKTATYSTTLTTTNSGRYVRCVVTDKYGSSVKSNAAYMKITSLKITSQPSSVTAKSGDLVTFRVTANGPGVSYQWQLSDDQGKTWRNSKATTATYSTTLSSANNGRYLRCVVSDKYGNAIKSNAAYMKISSLKITGQPANASGKKGALVTFRVTANGPGISYQWQLSDNQGKTWRNSSNKTATYSTTLNDLNNGQYVRCIVTDKYGNKLISNAASMKMSASATEPSKNTTTISADANGSVWVTASGKKYHRTPTCSNMSNPVEVTLEYAKKMGYTACQKCY